MVPFPCIDSEYGAITAHHWRVTELLSIIYRGYNYNISINSIQVLVKQEVLVQTAAVTAEIQEMDYQLFYQNYLDWRIEDEAHSLPSL